MRMPEGLNQYHQEVAYLESALLEKQAPDDIGDRLPGGLRSFVYKTSDGQAVIKIPLYEKLVHCTEEVDMELVENNIDALDRCRGVGHVEQLVEWSTSGPVGWVTEFAKGRHIDKVDPQTFTMKDYRSLIRGAKDLHERGSYIDANSSNILHHPSTGFTIIDYSVLPSRYSIRPDCIIRQGLCRLSRHLVPLPERGVVSEQALAFRMLCNRELGRETANALTEHWRESLELKVPDLPARRWRWQR